MNRQNSQNWGLKLAGWLLAEVLLTIVGLDNLADYGEFVFAHQLETMWNTQPTIALIAGR